MKRILVIAVLAIAASSFAFSQGTGEKANKERADARQEFLITGTVVDSDGAPVADKTVYLFPVRLGRVTMTLKVEGGRSAGISDLSAKTNKQGSFTMKVPEEVLRDGGELAIGVPEHPPSALSRDGKPLTFRIADRSVGKLDLGKLTLYCPNCSPW
jgi:hypothetical protein